MRMRMNMKEIIKALDLDFLPEHLLRHACGVETSRSCHWVVETSSRTINIPAQPADLGSPLVLPSPHDEAWSEAQGDGVQKGVDDAAEPTSTRVTAPKSPPASNTKKLSHSIHIAIFELHAALSRFLLYPDRHPPP
jgi:hypothetical protein